MDFSATKNPYEHYEQTTQKFIKLISRKKEMEETFHPTMVKEYHKVKSDIVSTAVELLKLGVQSRLDQDNVYLNIDDEEYTILRADMMKVINKNQWDELFPMDNVEIIKAEIETEKVAEKEEEAPSEQTGNADFNSQAMQNPLAAMFTAFGAAMMNAGNGNSNDMANSMALAIRQAFQPPQVNLSDEVGGIQRKIALLEKERDEAVKKCTGYKQALESATADVEELKAQHDEELENSKAEFKKEVENLKGEAEKNKSRAENAFKERDNLQKEVGRLNKAIEDGKNDLANTKEKLQKQLNDSESKVFSINREKSELKAKLEEATKKAEESLKNSVQKAKDEVSASLNKKIEELNKKNADLEDKLKDAQNNDELVKEYENKLSDKDKEFADLKKKYDELVAEVNAGKKQLSELQKKVEGLEQENKSLEELAFRDKKVGVYNNNAFNRDIQAVEKNKISLIVTGVRNMKAINEKWGRQAGDKLLQIAANEYKKEFGEKVYRVFGDEFVIITDGDFNSIISKLQAVKETLEAQQIIVVYGVCQGDKVADIKALVSEAEHAMVSMKTNPTMGGAIPASTKTPDKAEEPAEAEPEEVDMSDLMEEYLSTEN